MNISSFTINIIPESNNRLRRYRIYFLRNLDIKQMIGARIKEIRTKKGITQEQLSERMEINPKYLSSIERGKENPTLNTLIKLLESS
jgi:DNA-binding XRE family transcriptional regulator